jgi:CO/xanthine dehydrogenase FAD-binding subunit
MLGFEYVRAADVGGTVVTVSADPAAAYLAGGTTQRWQTLASA